ncbi:MAG: hypothetical protein IPN76_17855 [Saprospiraceae bacterium]|nr:hypothetical protein [Saprospiraceae bacterium]
MKEGTLFKDGKDANNIDLRYRLGNEVLIDKAKVAALSTLFMNKQMAVLEPGQAPSPVIEGLYIAPVANSADGKGEPFADPTTATWATLGAKESKFFLPNATEAQDHQVGRLGFVLASPVLWLQEGRRRIRVGLTCDISANTDISSSYFEAVVEQFKESGLLTYFKYCLTDNIVNKLENLCPSSKAYLQALLSEKNPYTIIGDLAEWIDSPSNPITCAKIFQPIEANQLFVALSDSLNKQRYLKKIHLLCAKSVLPTSSDELVFLTDLVESNSGAFKLESTFANDPNILAPIQKDLKALDIVERAFISDDLAQRIEAFFRLDNIENSPQFIYHLRPIHLNPDGPHATGNPLLLPENVRLNEYFGSLLEGRNSFPIGVNIGFG